jgi:hypothetical protein
MTSDANAKFILQQFAELQTRYPELGLGQNIFQEWVVRGTFRAAAIYEATELLLEGVTVEIILPSTFPDTIPVVRETTGLTKGFHTNDDGSLCLGSPLAVRATLESFPTLLGVMEQLIIPFFFAFKYWKDHGEVPFGELSHGGKGILEYYTGLFAVSEHDKVIGLLRILAADDYRGHLPCPCESRAIIRRCHGDILRSISKLQAVDDFLMDYYCVIRYCREKKMPIPIDCLLRRLTTKKK